METRKRKTVRIGFRITRLTVESKIKKFFGRGTADERLTALLLNELLNKKPALGAEILENIRSEFAGKSIDEVNEDVLKGLLLGITV